MEILITKTHPCLAVRVTKVSSSEKPSEESLNAFESIIFTLLSTCSMLFMISASDLIAMYLVTMCLIIEL
uniref:Uncharacterized protein n=1 Tax=Physcomitrium patens TaxID=3218 RepID=A0A2K1JKJ3_PHYPA|nr:hypothetical protein PHYPA_016913 [Physcomitrium patens]